MLKEKEIFTGEKFVSVAGLIFAGLALLHLFAWALGWIVLYTIIYVIELNFTYLKRRVLSFVNLVAKMKLQES